MDNLLQLALRRGARLSFNYVDADGKPTAPVGHLESSSQDGKVFTLAFDDGSFKSYRVDRIQPGLVSIGLA
jgi:hypothetical protein